METGVNNFRSKKIPRRDNPLSQIAILKREGSYRFHDYNSYELDKLEIIFSADITTNKNKILVEKYRNVLMAEIDEIYFNLQNMIFGELYSEKYINDSCPYDDCFYEFSKLGDAVYGRGSSSFYIEPFQSHLYGIVDFSKIQSL